MDKLPDEILLLIFGSLPSKDLLRCSVVNRRWNRLSRDESLWKVLDFNSTKVPLKILARFLRRGIQTLNLQSSTVEDPTSWTRLFTPNNLRSLDLTSAKISARSLGQILRSSSQLECLRLRSCKINHIAYKAMASNPNLEKLDLSDCPDLSVRGYRIVFEACLKLEDVNLSDNEFLVENLHVIKSTSLRRLAVRCCKLEYSGVTKCSMDDLVYCDCGLFVAADVQDLAKQCPNLTHLDISLNFVGSRGTEKLKKLLPNICELKNEHSDTIFEEREGDYLSDYGTDWDISDYEDSDSNEEEF